MNEEVYKLVSQYLRNPRWGTKADSRISQVPKTVWRVIESDRLLKPHVRKLSKNPQDEKALQTLAFSAYCMTQMMRAQRRESQNEFELGREHYIKPASRARQVRFFVHVMDHASKDRLAKTLCYRSLDDSGLEDRLDEEACEDMACFTRRLDWQSLWEQWNTKNPEEPLKSPAAARQMFRDVCKKPWVSTMLSHPATRNGGLSLIVAIFEQVTGLQESELPEDMPMLFQQLRGDWEAQIP
jgi:hypothetical protein